jgi:hypothetical protein
MARQLPDGAPRHSLGAENNATSAPAGTPVQMMVTIGHHYGHEPPVLTLDDLTVTETFEALPITNLTPLRGDRAGLELFLPVDNCSNCEPGSNFEELSLFISSQPPTTTVGVAYILNGPENGRESNDES